MSKSTGIVEKTEAEAKEADAKTAAAIEAAKLEAAQVTKKIVDDALCLIGSMSGQTVTPAETRESAEFVRDSLFLWDGAAAKRRGAKTATADTRDLAEVGRLMESHYIGKFNAKLSSGVAAHVRQVCMRTLSALNVEVAADIAPYVVRIAKATVHGGDRIGQNGTCLSAITLGLLNVAEGKASQLARLF